MQLKWDLSFTKIFFSLFSKTKHCLLITNLSHRGSDYNDWGASWVSSGYYEWFDVETLNYAMLFWKVLCFCLSTVIQMSLRLHRQAWGTELCICRSSVPSACCEILSCASSILSVLSGCCLAVLSKRRYSFPSRTWKSFVFSWAV